MKSGAAASPAPAAVRPNRLLVRGVNWLGDAVMTTPALVRLREALPETRLALVTQQKLADLWRHHPAVDEVLTIRKGEGPWSVSQRLCAGAFDTALVLPNSHRAAVEVWLAGIPRRVGGSWPWRNVFFTHTVSPPPGQVRMRRRSASEVRARVAARLPAVVFSQESHHLHHYLRLASALGASPDPLAPSLGLTDEEKTAGAARLLACAGVKTDSSDVWFGLNPGAAYGPAKRWPCERFAQAARRLSERTGCRWLIFGSPDERPLAEQVLAQTPGGVSLCGQTTLRELMIGLACCRLLLTNDTGPMHVAAALGTPVVALFGSTSPELTGPGLPGDTRHKLLRSSASCVPCFRRACPIDFRCMKELSVESVVEAALETWRRTS